MFVLNRDFITHITYTYRTPVNHETKQNFATIVHGEKRLQHCVFTERGFSHKATE